MKRLGVAALVLLVLGGIAYTQRAALSMALMGRVAARVMAQDPLAELADGIHVVLCGAGSPLPDPNRSGPCLALVAGGRLFLVDAGSSAARNLQAVGLPVADVSGVFLTHFHSDHIDGLGELGVLRWAGGGHTTPLPTFGPPGVDEVVGGFNAAYRLDSTYRVAHHGEETVPPSGRGLEARPFANPQPGRALTVYDEGGLKVHVFAVGHSPVEPAVGYRFDYAGRSVVVSGDTIRSAEIERMAEGADLLVHEALAPHLVGLMTEAAEANGMTGRAKITRDILDYHATPVDAAQTAQAAGARHLLFYHIVPPLLVPGLEAAFLQGVSEAYSGGVTLGRDGTRVSMPAGSQAIDVSGG